MTVNGMRNNNLYFKPPEEEQIELEKLTAHDVNEMGFYAQHFAGEIYQLSLKASLRASQGDQFAHVGQAGSLKLRALPLLSPTTKPKTSVLKQNITESHLSKPPSFSQRKTTYQCKVQLKPRAQEERPPQMDETFEHKKAVLGRCILSEDPAFPGSSSLDLMRLSEGLTPPQKKELEDFHSKATIGKVSTELALPVAAFSKVTEALVEVVKPVFKAIYSGAVSEYCLTTDAANYSTCVSQLRDSCEGRNPEVNKSVKEALPKWIITAAEKYAFWEAKIRQFDEHMAREYHALPGVFHSAVNGATDVALMGATGLAFRLTKKIGSVATNSFETLASKPPIQEMRSHFRLLLKDESGAALNPLSATAQIVDQIFKTATNVPKNTKTIPALIDVETVMNSSFLRDYGRFKGEMRPALKEDIQKALSCSAFTWTSHQNRQSGNTLHTIFSADNTPVGMLKEFIATRSTVSGFIPEIVSLKMLESRGLKHSSLPELLLVGKYTTENGTEKGLALYRFVKGESHIPALQYGRSLAEINSIQSSLPISGEELGRKIFRLMMESQLRTTFLAQMGIKTRLNLEVIEKITQDVMRRPGQSGLVHGDPHVGNFIFEKQSAGNKIVAIDTGSLLQSTNRIGQPNGIPALDFYQAISYLRMIEECAALQGRKVPSQIDKFVTGYREIYQVANSLEAERFAELFWDVMTLGHYISSKQPEFLIRRRLEHIETQFGATHINGTTIMTTKEK